jgi:hypothetical protein
MTLDAWTTADGRTLQLLTVNPKSQAKTNCNCKLFLFAKSTGPLPVRQCARVFLHSSLLLDPKWRFEKDATDGGRPQDPAMTTRRIGYACGVFASRRTALA